MEKKAFYEESWFWYSLVALAFIIGIFARKQTKVIVCGNANGEKTNFHLHLDKVE